MKSFLVISLLFCIRPIALAEGTAQVMPSATNGVALYISVANGSGPYRGAPSENRIRFYIKDAATENFYFGYRAYDRNPSAQNIWYRIVNASGTQVVAPTQLSSANGTVGRINSHAEAVAGPDFGTFTGGYTPRVFDPAANGEYYIELYVSTTGGSATDENTLLTWFDFTVANPTTTTRFPGRVYCQAWSFI
ncbi:MAG TPA: hypothetical protein VMR70_18750, partial [Flavisolibacter sp.]|nr:hypothetical protein [Flavisolibacter sp.]